jgi:putative ABC transport system substrate-binding protein
MLALPAAGLAQARPPRRPKRVAVCLPGYTYAKDSSAARQWYAKEFARHGLVDGVDIEIAVFRGKSVGHEANIEAFRQAVALPADVILGHMHGPTARKFVLPLVGNIPLVLFGVDDGTEDSIEMLNRRGENVTGAMYSFFEMVLKRFELMKELRPGARRAAFVVLQPLDAPKDLLENEKRFAGEIYGAGARKLGLEFTFIVLPKDVSPEALVRALRDARIDMAEISAVWSGREFWAPLAASGIAASGVGAASARDGALLGGWSAGYVESAVRLAARVVRGQRAADLPVERSMEYGFAVNLRTARKLGITVPPSLLVRAGEVFE